MSLFFFNDTATTEIYTLSLHDALPICPRALASRSILATGLPPSTFSAPQTARCTRDRKSTRLNSSHANISYAVFCLKKKKKHRVYDRARDPSRSVGGDESSSDTSDEPP